VIEWFIAAPAVLPMKLFTIFATDERALEHVRRDRRRVRRLLKRVTNHTEWGVRVAMSSARATAEDRRARVSGPEGGLAYLSRKKEQRDASAERRVRARETIESLYDRLGAQARIARRRGTGDLPAAGGPLLLDAVFLVSRSKATAFRRLVQREAKSLTPAGYSVRLTGPWPPYSFVQG
jgi:hypothetical protein